MKSNTMTNVATQKPKAIVFSNFPIQYFEKNLQPRLQTAGLEILRVINFDRSKDPEVGAADVLVAFIEVMSQGQRTRIKDLAKKAGKRFVALQRRGGSEWGSLFASVPVAPPSNVRPIKPPSSPFNPAIPAGALSAVEETPLSKFPVPTSEDLQDLLRLFEEENAELYDAKKAFDKTLQEREDAVLNFATKYEDERKKVDVLEGRIKEQTAIRGQLEKDLNLAKENVDALARQVEAFRKDGKTPAAEDLPTTGSAAAYKAHHTRLKGDLFDANERIKKLEAELAGRPTKTVQVAAAAPAPAPFDKAMLLAWLNVIRKAEKGDGSAYKGLLELAAKYNVDPATVLELVK